MLAMLACGSRTSKLAFLFALFGLTTGGPSDKEAHAVEAAFLSRAQFLALNVSLCRVSLAAEAFTNGHTADRYLHVSMCQDVLHVYIVLVYF